MEGLRPVDRNKLVYTGNPVRPAILGVRRRPYAIPSRNGRLRILVTGGSQGAVVFNEIVPKAVATLSESLRQRIDIVQQVPGGAIPEVKAKYDSCGVEASLAAFFDDMPQRLQVAHLVICRAGASTVAELAAAGRPAILVPYPSAAEDHQTSNAVAFVEAGGGWLMPQAALTPAVAGSAPYLTLWFLRDPYARGELCARFLSGRCCDAPGGCGLRGCWPGRRWP